jgi:aspartate/methionine/tyrosine aminotransferase
MLNSTANKLGTETAFGVLARAGVLAEQGKDIINLGIGQPDFKTPEHIVEAGIRALQDGAHGYTPSMGLPALREAVAEDVRNRYEVKPDINLIQIVPGGKPILFTAMMLLGGQEHEILTPDPGFPIYQSAINYSGAKSISYGLVEKNGFAFDADDVLSKITDKTSLVIVNCPANPTGGVTPRAELDKFVRGLEAFPHVTVLSDEIYDRLIFDGKPVSLMTYPSLQDKLIILNGWSKTYAMTGWRIGYGIWPQRLIDFADRLAVNFHSCVNAPTQHAAIAALQGNQSCVDEMLTAFRRRGALITKLLNRIEGVSCQQPAGAFYAFANITKTPFSSHTFQEKLLEEYGVASIAGSSFGGNGEGYIRLSCANSDKAIEEAVARIQNMLTDSA